MLKENAQILDPFCGVGTMLIERDIRVPAREKYGIDIFGGNPGVGENASYAGKSILSTVIILILHMHIYLMRSS